MEAANRPKGEVELEINGTTYVLRPTFRAIEAIESRLGGILSAWQQIETGLSISAIAHIIWCAVTDGGRTPKPTRDEIGEAVIQAGVASLAGKVASFIAGPVKGLATELGSSDEEEGEAEDTAPSKRLN